MLAQLLTASLTLVGFSLAAAVTTPQRNTGYDLIPVRPVSNQSYADRLPSVQIINTRPVDNDNTTRPAKGHFVTSPDSSLFSIYPPIAGCGFGLTTTGAEARFRGCSVAMNMGFFDINNKTHPHCLGAVVSDGVLVEHDATGNLHFGLTSNGSWFQGYVTDDLLDQHRIDVADRCDATGPCASSTKSDSGSWYFQSLASGQVGLVSYGKSIVKSSANAVNQTAFANLISGRTAIGVLEGGSLGMVQIDGRTGVDGIDLFTLADLMITLGFTHAINLDGGGSSTTAINGVLASTPSDTCPGDQTGLLGCERNVSTIVCVHASPYQFLNGVI